jgi:hypothetical protein
MKPITFECTHVIPASATEICDQIADMARWSAFDGYGFLPGIERAAYEIRTEGMVGSRIRVTNADGSTHVEEIMRWEHGHAVRMRLHEFSPPLANLASYFDEDWRFEPHTDGTNEPCTTVTRTLSLYPKRMLTRPLVWLISLVFRRAIAQHLKEMADGA